MASHIEVDMTSREIARFLSVKEELVVVTARRLGIPQAVEPITRFCSPYPFMIARNVQKFRWPNTQGVEDAQA